MLVASGTGASAGALSLAAGTATGGAGRPLLVQSGAAAGITSTAGAFKLTGGQGTVSLLRPVVCVCACVLRTCASRVDFSCHSLGMWSGSTASEVWGTSQLRLLVVQAWACSRC